MTILPYDPMPPLIGGVLIGVAAAMLLLLNGRIMGISGIYRGLLQPTHKNEVLWRAAFIMGTLVGGCILGMWRPESFDPDFYREQALILFSAGLLVGAGTKLSGGCTSGHGVCGIGRLSKRSVVATLTFMGTGFITVYIVRHWGGSQ